MQNKVDMKIKHYLNILVLGLLLSACGDAQEGKDPDKRAKNTEHSGHETTVHTDEHDQNEAGSDAGEDHNEHAEGVVKLSSEQMQLAAVVVTKLKLQPVPQILRAPGEVKFNAYTTVKITPRIAAQVVGRSVRLGDEVKKGQRLLTLSSVEMAKAQGVYLVAHREWQRVKKLGRKVVSERRYTEAKVNWEQARGRIQAYGMTLAQINNLQANKNAILANGVFQLLAPQAGRVLHDNFIVGERVEAGHELMVIADESSMWVEARVTPNNAGKIALGNEVQIIVNAEKIPARVSQINHTLDEATRTLAVRIEVANKNDRLHPGMFVSAQIAIADKILVLSVPEAAVLRSPDGDWQVLVEQDEDGEFRAHEVKLERVAEGRAVISGIDVGTLVVTQGAFFVQSELAKGGFEVHNH